MAQIDKIYKNLVEKILNEGYEYEDPKRKGVIRKELCKHSFIYKMKDGFPAITLKKLFFKSVIAELLWFLRGDTNIKYLVNNGVNIWNKDAYTFYCKKYIEYSGGIKPAKIEEFIPFMRDNTATLGAYSYGDVGRIYGAQWRDYGSKKVDQIKNLITTMKNNPMSTELIVNSWNPSELHEMALPPCHYSFIISCKPLNWVERVELYPYTITYNLKTDEKWNQLLDDANIPTHGFYLSWSQRSVDTFLGLPFNIASYAILGLILEELTEHKFLGLMPDLTNIHLYKNHIAAAKKIIKYDEYKYNAPKIKFSDKFYEAVKQFKKDKNFNIFINTIDIKDIYFEDYESYPTIKEEMIARDI